MLCKKRHKLVKSEYLRCFYLEKKTNKWNAILSLQAFSAFIEQHWRKEIVKGTVSPDYKCVEVISIKSNWLGHVTPDITKMLNFP
jgi:hypothetical protein